MAKQEITKQETETAPALIIDAAKLPSIRGHKADGMPISIEYWSPVVEGEYKRLWVLGLMEMDVMLKDFKSGQLTGEVEKMESVLYIEETEKGVKKRGYIPAKLLVSYVKDAIARGEIIPGTIETPVQITYLGKKLMKNGNSASDWQILHLTT
jgi:hypothetical protein